MRIFLVLSLLVAVALTAETETVKTIQVITTTPGYSFASSTASSNLENTDTIENSELYIPQNAGGYSDNRESSGGAYIIEKTESVSPSAALNTPNASPVVSVVVVPEIAPSSNDNLNSLSSETSFQSPRDTLSPNQASEFLNKVDGSSVITTSASLLSEAAITSPSETNASPTINQIDSTASISKATVGLPYSESSSSIINEAASLTSSEASATTPAAAPLPTTAVFSSAASPAVDALPSFAPFLTTSGSPSYVYKPEQVVVQVIKNDKEDYYNNDKTTTNLPLSEIVTLSVSETSSLSPSEAPATSPTAAPVPTTVVFSSAASLTPGAFPSFAPFLAPSASPSYVYKPVQPVVQVVNNGKDDYYNNDKTTSNLPSSEIITSSVSETSSLSPSEAPVTSTAAPLPTTVVFSSTASPAVDALPSFAPFLTPSASPSYVYKPEEAVVQVDNNDKEDYNNNDKIITNLPLSEIVTSSVSETSTSSPSEAPATSSTAASLPTTILFSPAVSPALSALPSFAPLFAPSPSPSYVYKPIRPVVQVVVSENSSPSSSETPAPSPTAAPIPDAVVPSSTASPAFSALPSFSPVFVPSRSPSYAYKPVQPSVPADNAGNDGRYNYNIGIVRQENDILPDGYHYGYETGNNIMAEEVGKLESINNEYSVIRVRGFFQYPSFNGKFHRIEYTADENGFVPVGTHLP